MQLVNYLRNMSCIGSYRIFALKFDVHRNEFCFNTIVQKSCICSTPKIDKSYIIKNGVNAISLMIISFLITVRRYFKLYPTVHLT